MPAVDASPWLVAALLGAYHGLNPGMGWLFAVFLGLQRRSGRVLALSLVPITLGHAASVALIATVVVLAQSIVPLTPLRIVMALALLGFGAYRLRNVSRHGSGLMLAPVLLQTADEATSVPLVAVHMAAMLAVMAATAWVVYARLGVAVLKRIWINY